MSIWVALFLITLCAVLWDIGIVLQKLATEDVPPLRLDRTLPQALRALLRSGRWVGGLAVSAAGWGLFAFALAFTPVSVARAIQGSGFVILALFSMLFLRHRLTAPEWCGVVLVTAGVASLGIAESSAPGLHGHLSAVGVLWGVGVCLTFCLAAYAIPFLLRLRLPWVIVFSIIAGISLGLGDVATKVLLDAVEGRGLGPQALAAGTALIVFYIAGFLVLSRAYQHGRAILVTAVSDLCSRLVAIVMGITALGEALAVDPRLRTLEILGYAGVISGAVLLARFGGEQLASTPA